MKSNTFNYSLLAVGVAAVMGLSTAAIASTTSGDVNNGAPSVKNIATATYSVNNIKQPKVQSNEVIVNITETANFTLYGMDGGSATDDKNENQTAVPGGTTPFKHRLINEGNISDTYTITTTGNDESSITTADPNYALNAGADVAYIIKQKDGSDLTPAQTTALTALGQPVSGTLTGTTKTIQLLPGLEAILTHLAATPTNAMGGNVGVGTLTATSQFITNANKGTPTLVNENQTLVRLPVFAITKTAACQGSTTTCETLNLNATDTDITYKVTVANVTTDYSADATNVIFRDVLPAGMTLIEGSVKMGSQVIPASAYTVTTTNGRQTLQGVLPQLNVGQDLTVEFKVKVDKAILSAAGSAKNDITLYDNFDNSLPDPDSLTGSDITDSTDDDTDSPRVPDDGPNKGKDTSSTITFTDRNLTIKDNDAKEIAVKGDEVTYTQTITNNGNANEGGTTRPINIKITDPADDVLKITAPYYVNASSVKVLLTPGTNPGEYLLPADVILAPTEEIVIGYTVVSDGKSEGVIGSTNNDINKSEANIVTLTPGGTTAPAASSVTNTTTIKGVELIKTQALDAGCKGTVGAFGTATLAGTPKDCIVYKITANNTFSILNVTNLEISDALSEFSTGATYRDDALSSVSSTNSSISVAAASDGATITTTVGTLTPADTATLQFSVKIKE